MQSSSIKIANFAASKFRVVEKSRREQCYLNSNEELMLEDLMLEVDVLGGRDGPAMD